MVVVGVAKVNNGVGATTFARVLAATLSSRYPDVYYIDADFRNPRMSVNYCRSNEAGWLTLGFSLLRSSVSLRRRWKCGGDVGIRDVGFRLICGYDAHRVYTDACPNPLNLPVLDSLYAGLAALLEEMRSATVVVDLGFTSLKHLALFAESYTLVYIDDDRIYSPGEAQKSVMDIAHYIVANKITRREPPPRASVVIKLAQTPEQVVQEGVKRLLSLMSL